jgi:hypothetical protein
MVRTGASFKNAAAEWLRYCEHKRAVKPGTLAGKSIAATAQERNPGILQSSQIRTESGRSAARETPRGSR